ncbi:hypothetical protein HGO97_002660 [Faecalicatena sp. AGMB00832]|uniref:Xylulokinase n=1 Tax=Faecalicatena faecalis TaxID=2726362 RepID=A0ABS6CZG3_9FIRM|nr:MULTISPECIES: FGGY family carbohydrate kinase [Faecalicatena]MBU3874715.1 hypothetical protein [Faecalicatena faecalis]MCI6464884.1 FGGY family carbohydrate kinase [Faecalicatena sp.]MDY5619914.1 FGGY family carbohydrate kinase [Lachnospiraceae bacterium]
MEKKYFLSIDRGQSAIKAAFLNLNADICYMESVECQPIQSPNPGWAQQDMQLIWEQTVYVIRQLLEHSGVKPEEVAAISFSGQGGGNFLISADGQPVYPGVLSMDRRHEEVDFEDKKQTEIPRTIAFMVWLKEKCPEVYHKTRWILGSKDWIRYCLTGNAHADRSDAPAPVEESTGEYQKDSMVRAGIPECADKLPPLKYASEICGRVTRRAAKETGLLEGTYVVAGAHDMIACSIGCGGRRQGHLTIIMGTMGINIAVLDKNTGLNKYRSGECFEFGGVSEGLKMVTTSIGSGCYTVNWMLELLFEKELEEAEKRKINIFTLLEERLLEREPSSLIFQPYLLGTFYNGKAKAGILGISDQTTREDILLALFEGVCVSMCMEIERLEEIAQSTFDDIWLTGGGSKSRIWGQMYADILRRPVKIGKTGEAGCRGAAVCAGIATGHFDLEENFPVPEVEKIYYPREEIVKTYKKQLQIYKQAYRHSADLWEEQK